MLLFSLLLSARKTSDIVKATGIQVGNACWELYCLEHGVQFQTHEGRTQEKKRTYCIWQKRKPLGCGSFGSVYVAINRKTGEMCATKEVHMFPDDPKSAQTIKQLEQEIEVLSNLKHPNIVQYYGSEIVEDKFYVFLEYVHPGAIRVLTCHIVSGLAYLHSKNIVHRDIKRANLLVDASGVVKLANFGTAKLGSAYWMAPELIKQIVNPDFALAVDIWSLGCTVIELYTGKPPWSDFEGVSFFALAFHVNCLLNPRVRQLPWLLLAVPLLLSPSTHRKSQNGKFQFNTKCHPPPLLYLSTLFMFVFVGVPLPLSQENTHNLLVF